MEDCHKVSKLRKHLSYELESIKGAQVCFRRGAVAYRRFAQSPFPSMNRPMESVGVWMRKAKKVKEMDRNEDIEGVQWPLHD